MEQEREQDGNNSNTQLPNNVSESILSFARILKDTRKKLGYSQVQFAEKLGINQPSLSCLESTTTGRRPTKRVVKKLIQ